MENILLEKMKKMPIKTSETSEANVEIMDEEEDVKEVNEKPKFDKNGKFPKFCSIKLSYQRYNDRTLKLPRRPSANGNLGLVDGFGSGFRANDFSLFGGRVYDTDLGAKGGGDQAKEV